LPVRTLRPDLNATWSLDEEHIGLVRRRLRAHPTTGRAGTALRALPVGGWKITTSPHPVALEQRVPRHDDADEHDREHRRRYYGLERHGVRHARIRRHYAP
jgi:hypothetical protein